MNILIHSVIILFVIQFCENVSIVVYDDLNKSLAEKFPWIVAIVNFKPSHAKSVTLGYGSLIHPRLVMTVASILYEKRPQDLKVLADCYASNRISSSCSTTRKVLELIYVEKVINKNYNIEDHDYGFLLLIEPFELNSKIGIINLAEKKDYYSQDECIIFIYGELQSVKTSRKAYYFASFKVTMRDRTINLYKNYRNFLVDDNDNELGTFYIGKMNFLASPITCRLKADRNQYVLVSFTKLKVEMNYNSLNSTLEQLTPYNNFIINIPNLIDEIDYILNISLPHYGIDSSGNIIFDVMSSK